MADSVMDSIIEKPNTKAAEPKKSQPSDEDNRRNNDCRVPVPGVTEGCGAHRKT